MGFHGDLSICQLETCPESSGFLESIRRYKHGIFCGIGTLSKESKACRWCLLRRASLEFLTSMPACGNSSRPDGWPTKALDGCGAFPILVDFANFIQCNL